MMEMTGHEHTKDTASIVSRGGTPKDGPSIMSKIALALAVLANILAVIALILVIVSVANQGDNLFNITVPSSGGTSGGANNGANNGGTGDTGMTTTRNSEDKIWLLQVGHIIANIIYIDESTGIVKGYLIDVVEAVCQIANKNCRIVWDVPERCWTSVAGERPRGGEGLLGRWYDACIGWVHTYDAARTFIFSTPLVQLPNPGFLIKANSTEFTYPDFTGLRVGFLDGWTTDEYCLDRYQDVMGFDPTDATRVTHFATAPEIIGALIMDQVDVVFSPPLPPLFSHPALQVAYIENTDLCNIGGAGLMTQKDQVELISWFNAAFENLKATSRYRDICNNLMTEHGDQPGARPGEAVCVN